MEPLSAKDSKRRWRVLLQRASSSNTRSSKSLAFGGSTLHGEDSTPQVSESDPFECESIKIPSTHALAELVLDEFVEEWKMLDDRRIKTDDSSESMLTSAGKAGSKRVAVQDSSRKAKRIMGNASRVKLPDYFDFATRQPVAPMDEGTGDRVISLEDPTTTLSYESELWRIFNAIPTVEQIEEESTGRAKLPRTKAVYEDIAEQLQINTRADGHGLSRLRVCNRHDLPTRARAVVMDSEQLSTISFECWRREPRRGSAHHPHRMIVEFLSSQTLKDVHNCIVDLVEDELWDDSSSASAHDGFFLIDGTFYVNGDFENVKPIQDWLTDRDGGRPSRRIFLGMSDDADVETKSMSNVRLDSIPWRLGLRYHHVHHGDVECAIFAIDMCHGQKGDAAYPLVHDIWTSPHSIADCEACRHLPAEYVTTPTCKVTVGHRVLCSACCCQLGLDLSDQKNVQKYSVWKNETELSTGTVDVDSLF